MTSNRHGEEVEQTVQLGGTARPGSFSDAAAALAPHVEGPDDGAMQGFSVSMYLNAFTHDNKTACVPVATTYDIHGAKACDATTYWVPFG